MTESLGLLLFGLFIFAIAIIVRRFAVPKVKKHGDEAR